MKTIIPAVIAIMLAAAAVFAVRKLVKPKDGDGEKTTVSVVAAAREIAANGQKIQFDMLRERKVDAASKPANAIPWSQVNRVLGQTSTRSVSEGDYLLLTDVAGMDIELQGVVPENTWAVPVTFSDATLVQFLQPGDEIAILGRFTVTERIENVDRSEKAEEKKDEATSVIFPCVKILDVGRGDGLRRDESAGRGFVIVALPPREAATLVAAQQKMELYPALRRAGDAASRKRADVGVVDEKTFSGLKQGLDHVVLPDGASK